MKIPNTIKRLAATCILWLPFFCLYAQVLQKPVSIEFKNTTVAGALDMLAAQEGVLFYYSSSQVNINRVVNKRFAATPIITILRFLVPDPNMVFTSDDNKIILSLNRPLKYTLSGTVKDAASGELLPYVNIYTADKSFSVQTNDNGYFAITLPQGNYEFVFSYVGYHSIQLPVALNEQLSVGIKLEPNLSLNELLIESTRDETIVKPDKIEIAPAQIKRIPAMLGENDVVKYLMLMPGIQKGSEGNNGMYVRGGSPDQNLILVDDAIVYNNYHLFGFNSLFTGAELKHAELYKGGFDPKFGGRLSSVLNMQIKDGNSQKMHGEAGIGFISSKLMLEGPLVKNKASYMFSARRTYLDLVLMPFENKNDFFRYYFYDIHGKVNVQLNQKHQLSFSTYNGRDVFRNQSKGEDFKSNNSIIWGNNLASLKWVYKPVPKLELSSSVSYSKYRLGIGLLDESASGTSESSVSSAIEDIGYKTELTAFVNQVHQFTTGISVIQHSFLPTVVGFSKVSNQTQESRLVIPATEYAWYASHQYKPYKALLLNYGLRLSAFSAFAKTYQNFEPRARAQVALPKKYLFSMSYSRMAQYQHLLSTFGLGLPTDVWLPVSNNIKPATANLFTTGISKAYLGGKLQVTTEGFYKEIQNQAIYKEGKSIVGIFPAGLNNSFTMWENMLTQGKCIAYGAEWLIKYATTKYTFITAYTLSKTTQQFSEVNLGRPFPAFFDRRHDLSLVQQVKLGKHFLFNAVWLFGSGYWFTLPVAEYNTYTHVPEIGNMPIFIPDQSQATFYTQRNNFRTRNYHRLDLGLQYIKNGKYGVSTIDFSVYNVYNQQNPFYHTIDQVSETDTRRVLKQQSLFGIIPSLSYNFKF